ncbi:hypothetical protein BDV95DRAFT_609378 [Massariosphaeria phaeospora]|uniref:RING-type E3 ubiquitin transferase n=1 Tax=Massariosphaeria phaeospora TaxID=100035 RepID=A0A7C8M6J7_9PLEO|nr:hypothetical protein BDV95DRAFT_609378 [Massariosphaeria phaeospora]
MDTAHDDPQDACVICLAEITERAITAPCNHYTFDFLCLVSWLQERSTCPLCKTEVKAVQYDWHSPTDYKSYTVLPTHPPHSASSNTSGAAPYRHRFDLPGRPRARRRSYSPPRPDIPLCRRRHVYRHKLYSLHVGSNRVSGYQEVSPETIATSPDLQSKARTWIRRELRVFTFLHTGPQDAPSSDATTSSNAEFLLTYIIAILKKVHVKASDGHAEDLLSEFLGRENAQLLLHELHAWLRSPFTKAEEWDRHVQYAEELPDEFDEFGMPMKGTKTRPCPNQSPGTGCE